jgi:transcriptional regulator with XRE-family HTH domain
MTEVITTVKNEYAFRPAPPRDTVIVSDWLTLPPDLDVPPDLTVPGLRFYYLLVQLREKGWTQTKTAGAIGCDQSLVNRWLRADFSATKGISASIIQGCMSGLKLHYDYFFADYTKLPVPAERLAVVETAEGQRPTKPGEVDAALFPIDLDRARDNRTRSHVEELRRADAERTRREAERDRQFATLAQQVALLTQAVAELTSGGGGAAKKAGAR